MSKLKKVIIIIYWLLFLGTTFSQKVVIEKVAKKNYGGYLENATADIIYNDNIITVILCEDRYFSAEGYRVIVLRFNRNTLNFISRETPFNKKYLNQGKFDCRPVVMKVDDNYGLYFIEYSEAGNKLYFQELTNEGELVGAPKELFNIRGKVLGKRRIGNYHFLQIFPLSRRFNGYYLPTQKDKLELFDYDQAERLFQGEKENFVTNPAIIYNDFNTLDPQQGTHAEYFIDSNNTTKEKVILEYSFVYDINRFVADGGGYLLNSYVCLFSQNDFTISIPGKWTTKIERTYLSEAENFGNYAPRMLMVNSELYVFYYQSGKSLLDGSKLCCSRIDWKDGTKTEVKVDCPYYYRTAFNHMEIIPLNDGSFAVLSNKPRGLTLYKLTIK